MVDLVAIAERLAERHGPAVPLDALQSAAEMSKPTFRAEVLTLAQRGRLSLHVESKPRVIDADTIDRDWHVADAGEVRYVAVARRDNDVEFNALGAILEDPQRARRIAFLEQLFTAILAGRRR